MKNIYLQKVTRDRTLRITFIGDAASMAAHPLSHSMALAAWAYSLQHLVAIA
jgi:hypothetical protein